MNVNSVSIQLASPDPDRLLVFYRDVVQLPMETEMGDHAFKIGDAGILFVVEHGEVSSPTKEPARAIIDLHIDNLDEEHERLKKAGVQFSREKGREYWGGIISTFADPDGNRIQLIEFRPELFVPEEEFAAMAS